MKRVLLLFACIACDDNGPNPFGTDQTKAWLEGDVYMIPAGTDKLPNFDGLPQIDTIYTSSLDVSPRDFTESFSSYRIEWFAIRYHGTINVKGGHYAFRVRSDDGADVFIDGVKIIDNDGLHDPTDMSAAIDLTAGSHELRVDYFQGPRYEVALQLWVTPPGAKEQILTQSF
jgi:hypothetical protein